MSKNDDKKKSFVMYDSFLEAMKHLNDAEFRECVLKIRDYALDSIDEESKSPYVNIILAMAKPNLDAARRRYVVSVENGKKGAEYGKLGGAPKGNQNARKNNPQLTPKQPLDVDANENVEENVDEEVNVKGDDDEGTLSGAICSLSSFYNSSIGFQGEEIVNESERLKEGEGIKELCSERRLSSSRDLEVDVASKGRGETPIYSKSDNFNSASSSCSEKGTRSSAVRPYLQEEYGIGIGEYMNQCYSKYLCSLVQMRMDKIPKDDSVFWRAVDLHKQIYACDDDTAIKGVNKIVADVIKMGD